MQEGGPGLRVTLTRMPNSDNDFFRFDLYEVSSSDSSIICDAAFPVGQDAPSCPHSGFTEVRYDSSLGARVGIPIFYSPDDIPDEEINVDYFHYMDNTVKV